MPSFDPKDQGAPISQTIPILPTETIKKVKAAAMDALREKPDTSDIATTYNRLRKVDSTSSFVHPAGVAGPAELSMMLYRIDRKHPQEPTITAKNNLLSGRDVPPKAQPLVPHGSGSWYTPVNTPLTYGGPFPMPIVKIGFGGVSNPKVIPPPDNYPVRVSSTEYAPYAHIAFVELDGQQAYKQALAWWVTDDTRYADNALNIIRAWGNKQGANQQWGGDNGPLEAGWGLASMSKALELLRYKQQTATNKPWDLYKQEGQRVYDDYVQWVTTVMLPQMDAYTKKNEPNSLANWHSTIAEAYIAFSFLTETSGHYYEKGKDLFMRTVTDYFRWGKGNWTKGPPETTRVLGECSETLRDIDHSQMGLGGLVQVAEMCWQQDEDLYSYSDCALAAALEFHARIINSVTAGPTGGPDESYLPSGFKYIAKAPKLPNGIVYKLDMKTQRLCGHDNNIKDSPRVGPELKDGVKYVRDIDYRPSGWEIGYNHYVGRLGMSMPETQKLLQRTWPDWYTFHWGQGTLTHGDTAQYLWRNGVNTSTICQASVKSSAVKK